MARTYHRTPPSISLFCVLALAAWTLLAFSGPAGVDADDEDPGKGATERWCSFPPPAPPPTRGVACPDDAPPAPPPPPPPTADAPGEAAPAETAPAEEVLREAPAPPPPLDVAPALCTRTESNADMKAYGPLETVADWNELSSLIIEASRSNAALARKAPQKILKDWGDRAPKDARVLITMTARLKDASGADVTPPPADGSAEAKAQRPVSLAGRNVADVTRRVTLIVESRALKRIAAEVGTLRKAGYAGSVEIHTSMSVTVTGTPSVVSPADREMTDCGCGKKPRPTRATKAEEEQAAQLYWFARKASDSKDRTRMIKHLREIIALPPNKYTESARKMLDSRIVPGY